MSKKHGPFTSALFEEIFGTPLDFELSDSEIGDLGDALRASLGVTKCYIIWMRYCYPRQRPTYSDLGYELDFTREEVIELEGKALRKLRKSPRRDLLRKIFARSAYVRGKTLPC